MTREEWYTRVERGTSGDMVYDILADWSNDEEYYLKQIESLEQEIYELTH